MKYLVYILVIIGLVGLNIGLFNNLQIYGQIPNLLLLLVIYFCLEKKNFDFFFVAFFSGMVLDFFSTNFFGGYTLSFLIVALLLYFLVNNFLVFELNWKILSLLVLGSLILLNIILWLYGLLAFKFGLSTEYVGLKIYAAGFLASFFYNWILSYPMYLFSDFIKKFIENLEAKQRRI